jgi:hypothetical protein
VTHNAWGLHNGQKQILPTLSFSENRQKPAKTGKIHILGSVDRMIFIYGLINGKYWLFIDISH